MVDSEPHGRRADRLDEYVRRATQLDEERSAALVDPVARQALFEEIIRMLRSDSPDPTTPTTPQRGPALLVRLAALAAAATVAVVAVVGLAEAFGLAGRTPGSSGPPLAAAPDQTAPDQTSPQGDVFGGQPSCVETYSVQALARRGFAFAGEVVGIGTRTGGEEADPYVPVTFRVITWFRGGSGDTVTVAMFPPKTITSVGSATYAVGSRLLVSGEARFGGPPLNDPVAWACGFTRWYNPTEASTWAQAF